MLRILLILDNCNCMAFYITFTIRVISLANIDCYIIQSYLFGVDSGRKVVLTQTAIK